MASPPAGARKRMQPLPRFWSMREPLRSNNNGRFPMMRGLGLQIMALPVIAWRLGVVAPVSAQSTAADPPAGATKITSATYRDNGADATLTLWRQDIPRIGDRELLGYFHQHPEQTSF